MNKGDILEEVGIYKLFFDEELVVFKKMSQMKKFITERINIDVTFDFKI